MEKQVTIFEPRTDRAKESLRPSKLAWQRVVAQYHQPSLARSLWQIVNTAVPFVFILYLMYSNLNSNFWLTLLLTPLAVGFQIRVFVLFHDCTHGSFFKSRQLNNLMGLICGIICLTPYEDWRHLHALHHATSGNLDRRAANQDHEQPVKIKKYIQDGYGLLTLTTLEYQQLKRWPRLFYQVYRNPLFLFVLIPPFQFLLFQRFPTAPGGPRERRSVLITNLGLAAVSLIMIFSVGWQAFAIVSLLVIVPSTTVGVWLFYVQHQFEQTYWKEQSDWDYTASAMIGSSYYKLPKVLDWFSASIGFHHIHHLSPRIPNYYLAKCQASYPPFEEITPITLRDGLKSLQLSLWDADQQKMISFKDYEQRLSRKEVPTLLDPQG